MKMKSIGLELSTPKKKCDDKNCPFHGYRKVRGRIFSGVVISKDVHKTVKIRWPRLFFIRKYERYEKRSSSVRVHHPPCIEIKIGDKVKVIECRPISKTKKFVIVENESA